MYDIVIVGGGPAGATLARLLGDKYSILIIDRRKLDKSYQKGNFEKCCGGLLAPDAQKMLAKLGLGVPKEVLTGPQLFTVRNIDFTNNIELYYQRNYINIDREKFDRWLISLIPSKVDKCFGSLFMSFKKLNNVIELTYRKGKAIFNVKTRYLVGADGAISKVRHLAVPNIKSPETYIAIQEYFKVDKIYPYFSVFFDEEVTDFYSWMIPKEDMALVGSALKIKNNPQEKFKLLINKLNNYGYSLDKTIKKIGIQLLKTTNTNQICLGRENVFLIGEAAGFISPSSAEGFSYAFKSAYDLARSFERPNIIRVYQNNTRYLYNNIKWKNVKSLVMYKKSLRKLAMQSNIMTMQLDNIK